jgi:hypothetical protein
MANHKLLYAFIGLVTVGFITGCHEDPLKVNYELGIFPDSLIALEGLNTQYDDYNTALDISTIDSYEPLVFSSNRNSSGGEFDLVHGVIWYSFGQTTGSFTLGSEMNPDPFLDKLTSVFNTPANEFGPCRFFNSGNGSEYMAAGTEAEGTGLDIVFTKYIPVYSPLPVIPDPVPATVFNSGSDDVYLSLSQTLDTAYFCSDRSGNFDIYMMIKPVATGLDEWFSSAPAIPVAVDSLCSGSQDKCPYVSGKYMVFASDMPGGSGGFDIYLSVLKDGKWGAPVNLGPGINTSANEYRPVLGTDLYFENRYLIFSSDRSGGMGGYDLYFRGFDLPVE